ncbi:hypothetical protein LBMAG46_28760 [Planctomycetia bacterium]|nr:hypothetical protein LBMAG46_28760 [Planctomycetia bacterium]
MFFEAFQQSGQHVEILCRAGCGDDGADRTADGLHVSQGRSEADPAEFGEESGEFFCGNPAAAVGDSAIAAVSMVPG